MMFQVKSDLMGSDEKTFPPIRDDGSGMLPGVIAIGILHRRVLTDLTNTSTKHVRRCKRRDPQQKQPGRI